MAPKSTSDSARMRGYSQEEAWFTKHNNALMEKLREKYLGVKPTHPSPTWEPTGMHSSPPLKKAA